MPIDADSAETFKEKIAPRYKKALVSLISDGGAVAAGIDIGETIRRRGFVTVVGEKYRCASACALAWLGGARRFFGTGSLVGFHAAYRLRDGSPEESGVGNALIGAYLNELRLPREAIIYITAAAPASMQWLTLDDANSVGIAAHLLQDVLQAPLSQPNEPASAPTSSTATAKAAVPEHCKHLLTQANASGERAHGLALKADGLKTALTERMRTGGANYDPAIPRMQDALIEMAESALYATREWDGALRAYVAAQCPLKAGRSAGELRETVATALRTATQAVAAFRESREQYRRVRDADRAAKSVEPLLR